jgi:TonB family protein
LNFPQIPRLDRFRRVFASVCRVCKSFATGESHFRLLFSSLSVPKTLSPKYQSTMARFGTARENSVIAGLYVLIPGDGVLLPLRNMAPLIKDSVEVANATTTVPTAQTSVAPKPAGAGGGTLRADALSLEVPVKVHGSRVTDAARGVAPHTEPFEEETGTMIVFPHGGVLRMSTAVTASQMLVVTNLKTRQDAICRVVKVRTFSNMQGYVEVEFTHQQPGYWGVHFPSEGPAAAAPAAIETAPVIPAAAPVVIPEATVKLAPVQNVSAPVAPAVPNAPVSFVAPVPTPVAPPVVVPPPAAPVEPVVPFTPVALDPPPPPPPPVIPVTPSKPEPTFISLGTQEKVQPAASSTSSAPAEPAALVSHIAPVPTRPVSVLPTFTSEIPATSVENDAVPNTPADFPAAPPAAAPASLTMTELRGDQHRTVAIAPADALTAIAGAEQHAAEVAEAPAQSSRAVFGSFSSAASLSGSHGVTVDAFGARLDGNSEAGAEHAGASRSNNWMLIAACVTLLFAALVGGVLYFRPHAANTAHNGASNSNTPAIPQPLAFQTPATVPDSRAADAAPVRNSATHPVPVIAQAPGLTPAIVANSNDANGDGPRIVPKPASNLAPGMVKNAGEDHPVAPQRGDGDQAVQAPSLDAAPAGDSASTGALSGIVSDSVATPEAPKIQQEGPVKVGGNVKEPRLVSRVMPEYPVVAKQAGIQGDVVVQTTIDAKGNVVDMKAVSGPALLRGPALAALRRWKYEPSTLNGQPIAVQMSVTIKFSGTH